MNKHKDQNSSEVVFASSDNKNSSGQDSKSSEVGDKKDQHQTLSGPTSPSRTDAVFIGVSSLCSADETPRRTRPPQNLKGDNEQRSKRKLIEICRREIGSSRSESEQDYTSEDDSGVLLFRESVYRDLPDILTFGMKHVRKSKIS
uniref:Uncharacterized protein n=1 Tax=Hanusia phi TaxID=3032 RepID=A0A7S0EP39_9CRYP|mmetsp:Transcript_28715/g.65075  ORF Transcript_28715/g.65075 Transcript_28715/m.65075 type:complete len:145 (+) Transcript_28715:52-486(+)